jgi:hypothetical protein
MILKQYVTGEGFPYLGRSHRLLLVDSAAGDQSGASAELDLPARTLCRDARSAGATPEGTLSFVECVLLPEAMGKVTRTRTAPASRTELGC